MLLGYLGYLGLDFQSNSNPRAITIKEPSIFVADKFETLTAGARHAIRYFDSRCIYFAGGIVVLGVFLLC